MPRARTAGEAPIPAGDPGNVAAPGTQEVSGERASGERACAEMAHPQMASAAQGNAAGGGDLAPAGGETECAGARDTLEGSRLSLVETATHTGTWTWDTASDTFAVSDSLRARFPSDPAAGSAGPVP
ncbi:MAG TPA: hypothetical protein VHN80_23980, partial [Kineosporiaceae bacterium]|nr:hypothetical protein [Kineosporiaceae bacterium]